MGAFEDEKIFAMMIRESANDGSDFTNPPADYRIAFLGEDGEWHTKDSAGAVAGFAGSGIASTIVAARGDILGASANDTPAVTTAGANGTVPTYQSGQATGILPQFPPGYEYNYTQITSNVTVTATTEGAATTIITASGVAFDGSTVVYVEFFSPSVITPGGASAFVGLVLYDDTGGGAASVGIMGVSPFATSPVVRAGGVYSVRLTPSSATHTYSVRGYKGGTGDGTVEAGAGGSGNRFPSYIRIVRA